MPDIHKLTETKRLKRFCDHLLTDLESRFQAGILFDDIKSVSRLEMYLKLYTRLSELERDLSQHIASEKYDKSEDETKERQILISELIKKIEGAGGGII